MGALLDVDAPQVNADGLQAEGVGAGVVVAACGCPDIEDDIVVVVGADGLPADRRNSKGQRERSPRTSKRESLRRDKDVA